LTFVAFLRRPINCRITILCCTPLEVVIVDWQVSCTLFRCGVCMLDRCACVAGYTGINCESVYLPCSPSPCVNGGSCVINGSHSYRCLCTTGNLTYSASVRCGYSVECQLSKTRSQAVARIADRTASQHILGLGDVIGHVTI